MTRNPTDVPLPTSAPPPAAFIGELRGAVQPARLAASAIRLTRTRTSDTRPVMIIPGLGTNDLSTWPLRQWLTTKGHRAVGWGLGVNRGDPEGVLPTCIATAQALSKQERTKVHLIGWSLGGIIAREIARDCPELCAGVIALATPIVGGPRFSRPGRAYPAAELDRIDAAIEERDRRPITVPTTAIYSRNDGIVNWKACIDRLTVEAVNIEVSSTHLSMGIDPDVWAAICDAIGRSAPDNR
jgi:pimeloyl-ACP methyl ester carboxylesterase